MSARPHLPESKVSAAAAKKMTELHAETVREVAETVARDRVVVVGMAQNPHVKNVKKALDEAQVRYTYLEFGSYFSEWRKRLAVKLWSGWPTFPQVFLNGTLIGGEELTKLAIANGELKPLAAVPSSAGAQATA